MRVIVCVSPVRTKRTLQPLLCVVHVDCHFHVEKFTTLLCSGNRL